MPTFGALMIRRKPVSCASIFGQRAAAARTGDVNEFLCLKGRQSTYVVNESRIRRKTMDGGAPC